jgi:hypothetical protein
MLGVGVAPDVSDGPGVPLSVGEVVPLVAVGVADWGVGDELSSPPQAPTAIARVRRATSRTCLIYRDNVANGVEVPTE